VFGRVNAKLLGEDVMPDLLETVKVSDNPVLNRRLQPRHRAKTPNVMTDIGVSDTAQRRIGCGCFA
jgi:hypothetical protein